MAASTESLFRGAVENLPARVNLGVHIAPENYSLERERIFRRAWMTIGHTQDLPHKGSYFVYEIPTFNYSLLAVRGQDDVVRVFHNICRHRGNKLVRDASGTRPGFTCNFHGWGYTAEGRLRLITDEKEFEDCDKEALGLVPVTSAVWNTFIFINLEEKPHCTLAQWLGELHGQYDGYFDNQEVVAAYQSAVNTNWHLGVNSFTEGYHTLYLHKSTARDYQGGKRNPERHRPTIEVFDRHHRYSAPGNPDKVFVPGEKIAAKYGRMMIPAFDFDCSGLPPGINSARHDYWAFDVLEIFPNLVVLIGNTWHNEISFWPIDAGRTLVVNHGWAYKTKNLGERISRSYFRARVRDVFREDMNTLEAQQMALSSGAMNEVVLSRQEMALRHHYKVTDRMMAEVK
ncbi:MAG: aromatic ring-hydroxylating dioxygenase subunit alpha [Betaproteobacteria bacterium]|nr:aromatic ring-hydroxylating dioxygenase subunit alpha [Betaproteobacteria bacterium]